MSQLSFFSADLTPPRVGDLGGLLAAQGQISRSASGAQLVMLLTDEWRAKALIREFRVRDVHAEYLPAADVISSPALSTAWHGSDPTSSGRSAIGADQPVSGVLLRSGRTHELDDLADAWTRGSVKAVPAGLTAGAGLLRCWALAAGRPDGGGFLLGLDRNAPDSYQSLASACAGAGLAGVLIGVRGGGPGLRIVGHRRHARLVELLGTPPPEAPPASFPLPEH